MSVPDKYFNFRPHPWHGLAHGPREDSFRVVHAFIEITPFDLVKYEIDKASGYLRVDRPQRSSSQPPAMYGFVPRTYCGERVRNLMPEAERGDGDPLDICVVSERPINKSEVILDAKVVGGLPMMDGGEADDKIIAVLMSDNIWKGIEDVSELPTVMVERLRHYFATYKLIPGERNNVTIGRAYGRERAEEVIQASIEDYREVFGVYGH